MTVAPTAGIAAPTSRDALSVNVEAAWRAAGLAAMRPRPGHCSAPAIADSLNEPPAMSPTVKPVVSETGGQPPCSGGIRRCG